MIPATRESRASSPRGVATLREVRPHRTATAGPSLPVDVRSGTLLVISFLATFYALRLARSLVIPFVLAVLLSFALKPIMRSLAKVGLKAPIAAILVVATLVGGAGLGVYKLASPAVRWMERAPTDLQQLEEQFRDLMRPARNVGAGASASEAATAAGSWSEHVQAQHVVSLANSLLDLTRTFVAGLLVLVALLYLLLATGDLWLRKVVKVLPTLSKKKRTIRVARRTEAQISAYLFTVTCINAGLGSVVALAMHALGLPNPLLWGVMAGMLNFVPLVGGATTASVLLLVGTLTYGHTWQALVPSAVFLLLNGIEAYLVTPTILSRRFALNLPVIFISIFFWGWLWGPIGIILAVPLLTTLKIVSDQVEKLSPIGEILGR